MLNHVAIAVSAARGGRALFGRADAVNGPHYRRGDEPRRESSEVRTRFIVEYCRAADAPADEMQFFRASRLLDNAVASGLV